MGIGKLTRFVRCPKLAILSTDVQEHNRRLFGSYNNASCRDTAQLDQVRGT